MTTESAPSPASSAPASSATTSAYPTVPASPSFPAIETEVLARWASNKTFQASIDQREAGHNGDNEFVFYDGPPFANGLPHYGHLLTGYVKDAVPRYQTMRGRRVERRFGWDTHGLPAELVAEKNLGVSGHKEIAAFGTDKFNEECRRSVLEFTQDWERYVTRQARWVDFENDYKTLDLSYMESVMWAFRTLWDKGLVYEGYRVLPYCWRCETPLSNTETRMDDVYRNRQDPAVTIMFPLLGADGAPDGDILLAWTTTPWTLPSNLATAVNPEVDYAVMAEPQADGSTKRYIMAAARLGAYAKELKDAVQVDTVKGSTLIGRRYEPLFPFFKDFPNAFQVCGADYVTTEDGTGIVHIAPAFGEEDKVVTDAAGIGVVNPINEQGRFTSEVPPYEDMQVFDANSVIAKDLRAAGKLVRLDSYDHSYPHCWRCANPLIYRAVSSWFVEVTKIRDRMVELNEDITWVPSHVKEGSFGKWIGNARDWSISRNRYWGSPIPVWKSDDPAYPRLDVYGSLDEMERDFGVRPTNLHRPDVDNLVRPNPDDPTGKSMMRRVPEVLDCWFESGSMPFAQVHYPFENKDWFEHHYPGDFIVEYIGQTRGWFYTLHVLATALFDRPAFRSCLAHGIVLGSDGAKMSKSLKNYPDVYEVFDTFGSDAMRWFLMSSSILRGTDLVVTEAGIRDSVRQVVLPLWNSWYFFTLYANTAQEGGYKASFRTDQTHELDQYILAKLHDLVTESTDRMDVYDLFGACAALRNFLEVLSNWYIRRSRDRFWSGDHDAFDTLYTVLEVVCRVAAPLLPLTTEAVYGGLTGADGSNESSVHLANWPEAESLPNNAGLVAAMDRVRDVCSTTSSVRKARNLRVRLPLASVTVASADAEMLAPFVGIIADEVNVKHVNLSTDLASAGRFELQVVPGVLGPRVGKAVQQVIGAVKKGEWTQSAEGVVTAAGVDLVEGEYALRLVPADADRSAALPGNVGVVVLDTDLTPELKAEGLARDLVRAVQQARKDADLQVSDRISLTVHASDELAESLRPHMAFVAEETLATSAEATSASAPEGIAAADLADGHSVQIVVKKA